MLVALLAFGILPTDSSETIQNKITKRIAYLNRYGTNEPEKYLRLIDKLRQFLQSETCFDTLFINQEEKNRFTQLALANPNIFNITLEQLYLLSKLFNDGILTTQHFLKLAQHANFTYENLDFYQPGQLKRAHFQQLGFYPLLFLINSDQHLATVLCMKETAIEQLIQNKYLNIIDIINFVLTKNLEQNETTTDYVERLRNSIKKWRNQQLSNFDWHFIQQFFSNQYIFKTQHNKLDLLLITSSPLTTWFYEHNVFSIAEFLLFASRHVNNSYFIVRVLELLRDVSKHEIFIPKKLRLTKRLNEVWNMTDRQLSRAIEKVEENKKWLNDHLLAVKLLKNFKREVYIDTVRKFENSLGTLKAFLDLFDDPELHDFLSLADVNIDDILTKRNSFELHLFTQMLKQEGISSAAITGKICPEFLLYIDPRFILSNSNLQFFLAFPQLKDSTFIQKIIDAISQHPLLLDAETEEQKSELERQLFTQNLYQQLNELFLQEVKNLIVVVRSNNGLFKNPPITSTSAPIPESKVERSLRHSYGVID